MSATSSPKVALVLSGGGARGAYAVGVVRGLRELLGGLRSRFQIFTGTSVGAINAAHFAACAHLDDLGVDDLARHYGKLRLTTYLRPSLMGWLGRTPRRRPSATPRELSRHGSALLDPRPFERIVCDDIPWDRLHRNIREGLVHALVVSGLRISDGRTTTFAELAPGSSFIKGPDPRRDARIGTVTPDHVLASAALPLLLPAREIDGVSYCDGGLRFNTPVSPAIRTGADRLVVIALRTGKPRTAPPLAHDSIARFPRPFFLLGKILDALLLDPVEYDLHVLRRINRVVEIMEETMPADAIERLHRVLERERGKPYSRLRELVFRPSEDLGLLAGDYMRTRGPHGCIARSLLRHAATLGEHVEADFVSYLLFDGGFARQLIELGRRDALARAADVLAFFSEPHA